MALSGSYDFTVTRNDIINAALRLIGAVAKGETAAAEDIADGAQALNMLVKAWQAEGIGLWLNREVTLLLEYEERLYTIGPTATSDHCSLTVVKTELAADAAASAASISVDSITGMTDGDYLGIELDDGTLQWTTINGTPSGTTVVPAAVLTGAAATDNHVYTYTNKIQRPLEILEARRMDSGDNETPLDIISRDEYMALANKTNTGPPNQIYYDPQLTDGKLYVWMACNDVQDRIIMTVKYPVQDFDAASHNADFPAEWLRALKFNLAVEIAPEFGREPSPTVIAIAVDSKEAVSGFDREQTSIYFQPDLRS